MQDNRFELEKGNITTEKETVEHFKWIVSTDKRNIESLIVSLQLLCGDHLKSAFLFELVDNGTIHEIHLRRTD